MRNYTRSRCRTLYRSVVRSAVGYVSSERHAEMTACIDRADIVDCVSLSASLQQRNAARHRSTPHHSQSLSQLLQPTAASLL